MQGKKQTNKKNNNNCPLVDEEGWRKETAENRHSRVQGQETKIAVSLEPLPGQQPFTGELIRGWRSAVLAQTFWLGAAKTDCVYDLRAGSTERCYCSIPLATYLRTPPCL